MIFSTYDKKLSTRFSGHVMVQSNVIMHCCNVFKYIYGSHKCEQREIIFIHQYMCYKIPNQTRAYDRIRDLLFIFLSISMVMAPS